MTAIHTIGGVGSSHAKEFRRLGIRTTGALLRRAAGCSDRRAVAERVGLTEPEVLEAVLRVDLMRIKGVGARYATLLNAAGVFTIEELAARDPEALVAMLAQINARWMLVRRLPNLEVVTRWTTGACASQTSVEYCNQEPQEG